MNWFHLLSSSELAAIVVGVTLVVSITGLAVTARRVRETTLHQSLDNGAIAGLLAALIGIYAIAAGSDGRRRVGKHRRRGGEGRAGGRRDQRALSRPGRLPAAGAPRRPARPHRLHGIHHRRRMAEAPDGRGAEHVDQVGQRFRAPALRLRAGTEGQKIVHGQTLAAYNKLLEARRLRLQAVEDTALPLELWVVVLLLGVIAISRASCCGSTASRCTRPLPCWSRRRSRSSSTSLR